MSKFSKQQIPGKAEIVIFGRKSSKNDPVQRDCIRFKKDIIAKGYVWKSTTEAASGKT